MTPREITIRNLELTGPERIGIAYGGGLVNDHCGGTIDLGPVKKWTDDRFEWTVDVWGNTWYRILGMSAGGEISRPVLEDWAMLDDYRLPDLDDPARYESVRRSFAAAGDRYRVSMLPGLPFAICRYLRRMEVYLQDLLLERDNVERLHDRVAGLLERMVDRYVECGADGIFTCEDWGTQERLLVSPALWREVFKPLYRRLVAHIHARGAHFLLHSCGNVWDIIDDLAEVGVDALQFDQPALYGLERLAGRLRSLGVCLYAPVDIQRILPTGDRALIEAEARKMIRLFGGNRGGFIARQYGDLHGIGVEPEWDRWAYDVFLNEGAIAS